MSADENAELDEMATIVINHAMRMVSRFRAGPSLTPIGLWNSTDNRPIPLHTEAELRAMGGGIYLGPTAEDAENAMRRRLEYEARCRELCDHPNLPASITCPGCLRTHAQIQGAERQARKQEDSNYQAPEWAPKLTTEKQPR